MAMVRGEQGNKAGKMDPEGRGNERAGKKVDEEGRLPSRCMLRTRLG